MVCLPSVVGSCSVTLLNSFPVYNISILANIPLSVFDLLEPSAPAQRLRPLFTIGVHDIPFLVADSAKIASKRPGPTPEQRSSPLGDSSTGWIACTTDSILAIKDDLWDVLITMPPLHAANAKEKVWPTVESPKGVQVKATQRDLRRFRTLKAGLKRLSASTASAVVDEDDAAAENRTSATTNGDEQRPRALAHRQSRLSISSMNPANLLPPSGADDDAHILAAASEEIVEPTTWSALAYSGFMWWASAGEQRRSDEAEEAAHDNGLLADLIPTNPSPANPHHAQQQRRQSGSFNVTGSMSGPGGPGGMNESITSLTARRATTTEGFPSQNGGGAVVDEAEAEEERARRELGIITYFHRLTAGVLGTLAEVVAATEDDYTDVDASRTQSEDVRFGGGEGGEGEGGEEEERLLRQAARSDDDGDDGADAQPEVRVDSEALAAMGLDVWSPADAAFVRDVVAKYFNRRARVEGKGVEVCGLRVC